jgi:hypothetical protein
MEVWLGAETQLGPSMCAVLTVYFLPPLHTSVLILGKAIYCTRSHEEFLSIQCCCYTVL